MAQRLLRADVEDFDGDGNPILTTATAVSAGPPPLDVLIALYADAPQAAAAVQLMSDYVVRRGWLRGVGSIAEIAGVPDTGCGAPGGDCEPAARLHALRALAQARGESMLEMLAALTRVSADGIWRAVGSAQ